MRMCNRALLKRCWEMSRLGSYRYQFPDHSLQAVVIQKPPVVTVESR
jgi:hypothetical protein